MGSSTLSTPTQRVLGVDSWLRGCQYHPLGHLCTGREVMKDCANCKKMKSDDEFYYVPAHLERRSHSIICKICSDDRAWVNLFPHGTDCVYLIKAENGLCKIGYTNHLARRLATLRTMSPVPLTLTWVWPGTRDNETALHRDNRRRRSHGEWFNLSAETIEGLRRLEKLPVVQKRSKTSMRTSRVVLVS